MAESGAWPSRPALAGRSPFVGREREMAALEAFLDEARGGSGRVALVAGEPGIGKTRLLTEFARRAAAEGWLVLFGRAYESEGMPPYLPFAEPLRQYVKDYPPEDLRTQLGRGAPEVARLAPELFERVPGIEPSPPITQDERYRLFEGVAGFLLNIARAGGAPLLLCLEDLHWADDASLRLLEHLARRLPEAPLLVIVTCRTAAADRSQTFTEVVTGLQRARLCDQIDVPPFSAEEAGQLVAQLAGAAPAQEVIEAVHRETGGNPFFLEEVVRNLQSEGSDLTDAQAVVARAIPESVRRVIGVRLSRLQPETLYALQVAAALGDPFSFDTLAVAAGGVEFAHMLDAMDEASAGGFVREGSDGNYHFSHALVRETLYAGLSGPRRVLLHAQVAERLEPLYRANAAAHAGELARHFLLGGRQGDLGKAMGYALRAAERATFQMAFEEAVRYCEMALDAHERSGEEDEARRCEVLLALAAATFKTGDVDRCDEINLAAAETARAAGLPELLARACLATAAFVRPNPHVIAPLEHALAVIPAGDSSSRSGLLSLLACQRSMAGTWEEQAPWREESIAMARRLGDVRALTFALRNAYIAWNPNRLEERRQAVGEVVQLAREMGDKELEVTSLCDHLTTSLLLCDIAAVDAGIGAHVRLADELQQRMQVAHGLMLRAMRALLSGPLSRAEELNAEMQQACQQHSLPWAEPSIDVHTLLLRWEQGRLAELEPGYRERQFRQPSLTAHASLAFICAELGGAPEARALLDQIDLARLARIPARVRGTFILALLSQPCAIVGATAHADVIYSLLLPHAREVVTVFGGNVCLGSACHHLGLLATTLRRFDEAERHFDDSDAMNTRLGARPLLAHTKLERARMLIARHARGDAARAQELLQEAAGAFDALEIPYHAGKARELLEKLRQATAARYLHPGGLSTRELEILRLVALAMSSKEIADELVLSVRTVERHIANIYLKTSTHGRVAAAAYAQSHGLVPPPA